MTAKIGTLVSILATMLMLGCALVPAIATGESEQATTATSSGETNGMDLIEFLGELKNGIANTDGFDLNGAKLIPAEKNEGEGEAIDSIINGIREYGHGKVYTIPKEVDFYKEMTPEGDKMGQAVIVEGSTLKIFPVGNQQEFTLADHLGRADIWDDLIVLQSGAYLDIFGMTFKVILTSSNTFPLLGMVKNQTGDSSCTFSYTNALPNNGVEMTVISDKNSSAIFANMTFDPENDKCLDVKGTLVPLGDYGFSFTDTKVSFSSKLVREMTIGDKDLKVKIAMKGTLAIREFDAALVSTTEKSSIGTMSLDATMSNGDEPWFIAEAYLEDALSMKLQLNDVTLRTGDVGIEISQITKNKSEITAAARGDVTLQVKKAALELDTTIWVLTIPLAAMSLEDLNLTVSDYMSTVAVDKEDRQKVLLSYGEGSFSGSVKSVELLIAPDMPSVTVTAFGLYDVTLNTSKFVSDEEKGVATTSVDEMTVAAGRVTGALVKDYSGTLGIKLTKFVNVTEKNSKNTSFNADSELMMTYNGKDRFVKISVQNGLVSEKSDDTTFTADRIYGYKDIPNSVFVDIPYIDTYSIPDYIEIEAKGYVSGSDDKPEQAEYVSVKLKNIGIFTEFGVEFTDNVKIGVQIVPETNELEITDIKCGKIAGSFRNIGMGTENFSITDNPEVKVAELEIGGESHMAMEVVNGNVKFGSGVLYLDLVIDRNVKFSADGVTLSSVTFMEGGKGSGTVTLRSSYMDIPFYSEISGITSKGTEAVSIRMEGEGFIVKVDLSDPLYGKAEALRGYILPKTYQGDGYVITSDDGKTGKVVMDGLKTVIKNYAETDSFTLGYADDTGNKETHRYGETVRISGRMPAKEGMTFLGWTDGTAGLAGSGFIQPGDEYIMPARNVTLRPVYMTVVTPVVKTEGEYKVLVVEAGEANIAKVVDIGSDWDVMRIHVNNTTVEFTKKTYDELGLTGDLHVESMIVDSFDNEYIEKAAGKRTFCEIVLMDGDQKVIDPSRYNGNTSFRVTINMPVDGIVKGFEVSYFDADYGYFDGVGGVEYCKCGNGTYDVTFTVNHFSLYSVEPICVNTVNNIFILVILIIVIILACVFVAAYVENKRKA